MADRDVVPSECDGQPPRRRIQEAISSTRRWHRDHKTTALADADFVANYLKQQYKRDPAVAVLIQRAIQRHVLRQQQRQRRRRDKTPPRPGSRPRSLEDFCHVTWTDVLETVETILVRRRDEAVEALCQQAGQPADARAQQTGPGT